VKLSSDLPQDSPACFLVVASMQISRHHDGMAAGKKVDFGGSSSKSSSTYFYSQRQAEEVAYFPLQQSTRSGSVVGSFMGMFIKHTYEPRDKLFFMTSMQLEDMGIYIPVVPVCLGCPRLVYS
jgi:hypothetical protein